MNNLELIPVMEIYANCENITFPQGPYWKNPEEFEKAKIKCLAADGYEPMQSYSRGSSFYEIDKVTDTNLLLEIKKQTIGYEIEQICPFFGGYVLNVNGRDMLFPQCCGDLSDINYWKELSNGITRLYWEGHPQPDVTISGNRITLDLDLDDEDFCPTPVEKIIEIDLNELKNALNQVMFKLQTFADRIDKLSYDNNIGIDKVTNLLVWGIHL